MHEDYKYIKAIKENNGPLIEEIYEKCRPVIIKMVRDNKGSTERGKDVFQEALIAVYNYEIKEDFVLTCTFCSFLYGFARKIWIKKIKKLDKEVTFQDLEEYKVEQVLNTLNNDDFLKLNADRHLLIAKHTQLLRERCRKILLLYQAKKPMEEIAKIMGFSNSGVARKEKRKCLLRLIDSIKNDDDFNDLSDKPKS